MVLIKEFLSEDFKDNLPPLLQQIDILYISIEHVYIYIYVDIDFDVDIDIVIVKIICIYIYQIDYHILFLKTTCRNSYTAPFSNDSAELLCITKPLVTKKNPQEDLQMLTKPWQKKQSLVVRQIPIVTDEHLKVLNSRFWFLKWLNPHASCKLAESRLFVAWVYMKIGYIHIIYCMVYHHFPNQRIFMPSYGYNILPSFRHIQIVKCLVTYPFRSLVFMVQLHKISVKSFISQPF